VNDADSSDGVIQCKSIVCALSYSFLCKIMYTCFSFQLF